MPMQALPDIYEKYRLYLIYLKHLLDFPSYFDLKFRSLWESCGMTVFHIRKTYFSLICAKWFFDTVYTNKDAHV